MICTPICINEYEIKLTHIKSKTVDLAYHSLQVFAWGDNAFGQVGIGSVGGVVEKPTKVLEGCDGW